MNTEMDPIAATADASGPDAARTPLRPPVRRTRIQSNEERALAALTLSELRDFRRARSGWIFFSAQPAAYQTAMLDWVTGAKQAVTRGIRLTVLINASSNSERSSAGGWTDS